MHEAETGAERSAATDWALRLVMPEGRLTPGGAARLQAQGVAISPDEIDRPLYESILVRARDPGETPERFFGAAQDAPGYEFDPFELDFARAMTLPGEPVEAFLFRRLGERTGAQDFEARFDVLWVGPLVARGAPLRPLPPPAVPARAPVALGIVDDAIAILHPRFRAPEGGSRFRAVWFQTQGGTDQLLDRPMIDAELARLGTRSEQELYAARAAALYPAGVHHSLTRAASHGTLMLDLAGGADPAEAMARVPLYAVQLPPQVFDDTSGERLQVPLVRSVHWLIYRALVLDRCQRLVVNLSLGVVAGPKDGSSFVEHRLRRAVDLARAVTGRQVDLVLAYGNAHEDRLVARQALAPGEGADLGLQLQPDDLTPSLVEVRLKARGTVQDTGQLSLTLISPDGRQLGGLVPPGPPVELGAPAIAAIYHQAALGPRPGVLTACFAPTTRAFDGDPICPAGR